MRDPKLGYHWIWIVPLMYVVHYKGVAEETYASMRFRIRKKFWHKETKEISKLAGNKFK